MGCQRVPFPLLAHRIVGRIHEPVKGRLLGSSPRLPALTGASLVYKRVVMTCLVYSYVSEWNLQVFACTLPLGCCFTLYCSVWADADFQTRVMERGRQGRGSVGWFCHRPPRTQKYPTSSHSLAGSLWWEWSLDCSTGETQRS